jgi:hypothetical protein
MPINSLPGRPAQDRTAIARTFMAKMIYNLPTTRSLLDRLKTDKIFVVFVVGNVKIEHRMNGRFHERLLSFRNLICLSACMKH